MLSTGKDENGTMKGKGKPSSSTLYTESIFSVCVKNWSLPCKHPPYPFIIKIRAETLQIT